MPSARDARDARDARGGGGGGGGGGRGGGGDGAGVKPAADVAPRDPLGLVIHSRWRLTRELGAGGFGAVYRGEHVRTRAGVAVKLARGEAGGGLLRDEYAAYQGLRNTASEVVGVPEVYFFGRSQGEVALVMELLGESLEDVRRGAPLSGKSVLMVGVQMLRRLQLVHHKGLVHRDVKPGNMVVGRGREAHRVYLVDFGVAKRFREYGGDVVPKRWTKEVVGSVPFISVNAHFGVEQARRDDLEALGYSLVYLWKGSLPWQEVRMLVPPWGGGAVPERRVYNKVRNRKMLTPARVLCDGMPAEMVEYFRYVRSLRYEERPDYSYLRGVLRSGLESLGEEEDRVFDWLKGKGRRDGKMPTATGMATGKGKGEGKGKGKGRSRARGVSEGSAT